MGVTAAVALDELTATAVKATYQGDKAVCDTLGGNAKDICVAQAKARQAVSLAEVKFQAHATEQNRQALREARIEGDHAVSIERCDDKSGNLKAVCRQEAQAVKTKAMIDLKAEMTGHARGDILQAKADADYKVARARCDSLLGGAKDACVKEAQLRFGKS